MEEKTYMITESNLKEIVKKLERIQHPQVKYSESYTDMLKDIISISSILAYDIFELLPDVWMDK